MLGVTCHVQKSCTLLILVVKIEICFYYKWHWDTSKLDGDLSLDFSHRMSRYVLYFCRRKWLIRERNISPTVKFRPTPKISHRTEHGGVNLSPKENGCKNARSWKETKKKTPIPIVLSCYLQFCVCFFCVATFCWLPPPLKNFGPFWFPSLLRGRQSLLHRMRWGDWRDQDRWVVRCVSREKGRSLKKC